MIINKKFIKKNERFRSIVRLVGETIGYSTRKKKGESEGFARRYTFADIERTYSQYDIRSSDIYSPSGSASKIANDVLAYMNFRADVLDNDIRPNLMTKKEAEKLYTKMKSEFKGSKLNIHMNKQKGEKSHPNYLVNMVNLVAYSIVGIDFDPDPMKLGIQIDKTGLVKTLPRRMDGAIPGTTNPKIVREIKEYYNTTTFGSRIADGVYESMLVGEELKSLKNNEGIKIHHVLFTDNYLTWWKQGRSYLCRFVDLVHMGLLDQVFFGKEVYTQRPLFLKDTLSGK